MEARAKGLSHLQGQLHVQRVPGQPRLHSTTENTTYRALGRLRQDGHECAATLNYTARSSLLTTPNPHIPKPKPSQTTGLLCAGRTSNLWVRLVAAEPLQHRRGSLAALKTVGGILSPFPRTSRVKGKLSLQKNAHLLLSSTLQNRYRMEKSKHIGKNIKCSVIR